MPSAAQLDGVHMAGSEATGGGGPFGKIELQP